jgi:hypothetical protein
VICRLGDCLRMPVSWLVICFRRVQIDFHQFSQPALRSLITISGLSAVLACTCILWNYCLGSCNYFLTTNIGTHATAVTHLQVTWPDKQVHVVLLCCDPVSGAGSRLSRQYIWVHHLLPHLLPHLLLPLPAGFGHGTCPQRRYLLPTGPSASAATAAAAGRPGGPPETASCSADAGGSRATRCTVQPPVSRASRSAKPWRLKNACPSSVVACSQRRQSSTRWHAQY